LLSIKYGAAASVSSPPRWNTFVALLVISRHRLNVGRIECLGTRSMKMMDQKLLYTRIVMAASGNLHLGAFIMW